MKSTHFAAELNNEATHASARDVLPVIVAITLFSAASIWYAIRSTGFLETDSLTHYLYARFAFDEPHYFVNIWGRPFVTTLYSLPAILGGRLAVRLTSLVLALLCGVVAYFIARKQQHPRPGLALVFTLAQPLVFLHSFSELTELPFALLIGAAFLAYQHRQFLLMALLIGLSPTARPEGFGFLILAGLALLLHRRARWIPLLVVPLVVWGFAGWKLFGSPVYESRLPKMLHGILWLKHEWPYAQASLYPSKSIFHFVGLMPAVISPIVFPGLCVGAWQTLRQLRLHRQAGWKSLLENNTEALIAIIPLLILIGHSILTATGRMASSGEMRYMAVVAPFWGVLAGRGWGWCADRLGWRRPYLWAGLAAVVPLVINAQPKIGPWIIGYRVLPVVEDQRMVTARSFVRLYRAMSRDIEYPYVLAANPSVYYYLDESPAIRSGPYDWSRQTVALAPAGAMLVWNERDGKYNSDANRSITLDDIESAGWVLDEEMTDLINDDATEDADHWSVWLSRKSLFAEPHNSVQRIPSDE